MPIRSACSSRRMRLGLREGVDLAGRDHRHREARGAHRVADARGERHVDAERILLVARDAAAAAPAGVGVGGLADRRLLRVVELAAARDREEVEAGAAELDADRLRVLERVAADAAVLAEDVLAAEVAAADQELAARPPRAPRRSPRAAGACGSRSCRRSRRVRRVRDREKGRHRVGVREVQLDAVEAAPAGRAAPPPRTSRGSGGSRRARGPRSSAGSRSGSRADRAGREGAPRGSPRTRRR